MLTVTTAQFCYRDNTVHFVNDVMLSDNAVHAKPTHNALQMGLAHTT